MITPDVTGRQAWLVKPFNQDPEGQWIIVMGVMVRAALEVDASETTGSFMKTVINLLNCSPSW